MDDFYFFTIFIALLSFGSRKLSFVFSIVGVFIFLSILPDTGFDYSRYEATFEGGYLIDSFPFFKTHSTIDAEPLYLWYNAFMSFVLNKNFQLFLSFNFLVCVFISKIAFKEVSITNFYLFWIFLLPVIIPTIFYYSPRSSISFFLILFAFMKFIRGNYVLAILAILAGISIHSQFLLISALLIFTYFFLNFKSKFQLDSSKRYIIIIAASLTVLLIFINYFSSVLVSLLSFLPSADLATAKLHYFETAREGFRVTSILSIIVYPLLAYKLVLNIKEQKLLMFKTEYLDRVFIIMLFAVICYGASINIAYFNNPHLAGRLSRFSDYIGMGILLPLSLIRIYNKKLLNPVLVLLVILSPIIFGTLYHNVDWGL
ncbi:hypothetical protein JCM19275_687 [Nonlabens ulvanivorans]|uniref:Uncharacterized protein n=1 Tax=Nonlabens ulvanivorans TaxID=906888 RepID=A0A090WH19_NONUL|nr:EpsG family protein [Nonlabens ulvanivorans]GAL76281.1 hypothetical protein JCM19275_687 [Nonlabens ulvanivorans]